MTAIYGNTDTKTTPVYSREWRENLLSSLWPKVKMKNGPQSKPEIITDKERFKLLTGESLKSITSEYQQQLKVKGKTPGVKNWRARSFPGWLPGPYNGKGADYLQEYCPKIVGDIDGLSDDENELSFLLEDFSAIPFIYAVYPSPSFRGVRFEVLAKSTAATHYQYEEAIFAQVAELLSLEMKQVGEAVSGLHLDPYNNGEKPQPWIIGHAPHDLFFVNWQSEIFHDPTITVPVIKENRGKRSELQLLESSRTIYEGYKQEMNRAICEHLITELERDRKDITSGMGFNSEWFALASAFVTEFGEQEGGAFFHRVSQFYDGYTEKETEQTIKAAVKKGSKGSIGTFYNECKQHGYEFKDFLSDYFRQKREEEEQRKTEERRSQEKDSSGTMKSEYLAQVGEHWKLKIITPQEITSREMKEPKGFKIVDNSYEFPTGKKGDFHPVSNFTVTSLYLLKDQERPKRVLRLENKQGEQSVICCDVKAMTSSNEFTAIVEGQGNFVPYWSRVQFAAIKEYIYPYEEVAEEITVLGYQPDTGYYAFANGIFDGKAFHQINPYGIVNINGRQFYLPAFSKVNEDAEQAFHNERKFIFQSGECDFKRWSTQLVQVFGDNAKVGICFTVAAIFRDIVFSRVNCFPLLFLFGPKGTGKTTFRNGLHRLFGDYGPNDAIGLGSASSSKGMSRKLAQLRNALSTLEEYKNSIGSAKIEGLKNYYDGIGYERAQTSNDNRTHATHVNSAIIVGGQEMPTKENALFSRVLMLTFGQTKFSLDEKEAFAKLEKMIARGMGNVLLEIASQRERVDNYFFSEYNRIYSHLRKDPTTNSMEERTLTNVAAILAPFKVLSAVLQFPFDYKDIYQVLRERIRTQHQLISKTNEVNLFWQVFDSLDGNKIAQGAQYGYKENILYVYLRGVYQIYAENAVKQGIDPLPQPTLEQYLKLQTYCIDDPNIDNRISLEVMGSNMKKQVRCLTFNAEQMQDLGLNFLDNRERRFV